VLPHGLAAERAHDRPLRHVDERLLIERARVGLADVLADLRELASDRVREDHPARRIDHDHGLLHRTEDRVEHAAVGSRELGRHAGRDFAPARAIELDRDRACEQLEALFGLRVERGRYRRHDLQHAGDLATERHAHQRGDAESAARGAIDARIVGRVIGAHRVTRLDACPRHAPAPAQAHASMRRERPGDGLVDHLRSLGELDHRARSAGDLHRACGRVSQRNVHVEQPQHPLLRFEDSVQLTGLEHRVARISAAERAG